MKWATSLLFISILLSSLPAMGEIYKWVDKEGNVHFGDKPQSKVNAETVKIDKFTPDQNYRTRMESMKSSAESQREKSMEKKAEQQEVARENTRLCQQAKRRLIPLKQQIRVFRYSDTGEREYVSDSERAAEIKQLDAVVKRTCQ
ncbi:MAG: DUF4124 domain-containing protein [Gammaproteobacteria bacterium]|nr:DUF4124 domain-containing protein [Gammaproteobacteria bacterium]MCF6229561.1 DUF4124 domain-containing protein [Gammaproteobacteria bacterium]